MLLHRWLQAANKKAGSDKAVVYRDTYLSWRGLAHRVDRRAAELHGMGIGAGDWVGLMLGNVPEFVILTLAISKVKGVVVPLDPTTGSRELESLLAVAPLRGLITRPRGGESAAAGAPPTASERKGRAEPHVQARRRLQGTLLTCSIHAPSSVPDVEDAQAVLVTADSCGDAKGVVRSGAGLLAATDQIAETLDVTAKDRILAAVPLYHAYGFDFGLALALRTGATLYLEDELSEKRITKALREDEVNFLPGTSAVYEALCRISTARPIKTKKARFLSAESRLERATYEQFQRRYGVRLMSCYHTTEAGPVAVDLRGQEPGTVGKPFEGVKVRVGDGDGDRDGGGGEGGSIWVKSGAISRRSVGSQRAADGRRVPVGGFDAGGWLRTGDLGKLDRAGRLSLTGREDDVVKVEGKRIALGEVEACIESFPRVAAVRAAIGRDPLGGSIVVARVVPRGVLVAQDIIDHCAKNLAPYKVPRRVEFFAQLP
ncbi:MAG: class I adenylate-forming enzyme family protein [Myxococcota bacterium]